MNKLIRESLDRTLLLMRDELHADTPDVALINALMATEVVLVGNRENLVSHAAQCAFITAAILMARSGHRIYLQVDDVPLIGYQPPLTGNTLLGALLDIGVDLLPGVQFQLAHPKNVVDLCVCFGDSESSINARRTIHINASAWTALLSSSTNCGRWIENRWPFGSLAAAALAAGEAFKMSMHMLRTFALEPEHFDEFFAFSNRLEFSLAPSTTPQVNTLGQIDCVSGGAISNAVLYSLARILDATGELRVIEPAISDMTNLNRYMLLLRSRVGLNKGNDLQTLIHNRLFSVSALPIRFEESTVQRIGQLSQRVIVGVDHIPTRWSVQAANPYWLGVGATTHWNAMSSFHHEGIACVRCLHARDDVNDAPIPTVAFVSFWSGLLLATQLIRSLRPQGLAQDQYEQQIFLTPLRPEAPWRSAVASRPGCPKCARSGVAFAA